MRTTAPPEITKESFNEELKDYQDLGLKFSFNGKSFPIEFCEFKLNDLLVLITKANPSTGDLLKEILDQKKEFLNTQEMQFVDRTDYLFRWSNILHEKTHYCLEFKIDNQPGVHQLLLLVRWSPLYLSGITTLKSYL